MFKREPTCTALLLTSLVFLAVLCASVSVQHDNIKQVLRCDSSEKVLHRNLEGMDTGGGQTRAGF